MAEIAAADTTTDLAPLLAEFAEANEITIPDGMLNKLAGDVLITAMSENTVTFTATAVDASEGISVSGTFSGTIQFNLAFDPESDLLADAPNPIAVFQYDQILGGEHNGVTGLPTQFTQDLRLNQTGVRMEVTEILQSEIDEIGPEGIAALFGEGVTVQAGTYTNFDIWISGATGSQDPETGEYTISGPEVIFSTLIPGEVGFEAFLDGLATGNLPLSLVDASVFDGRDPETGEDILAAELTASVDFEFARTATFNEEDLVQQLNELIALRTAIDAVLDATNDGELTAQLLQELGDAIPDDSGASPYLSGELISAAAFKAYVGLATLSEAELAARLDALNETPPTVENLTDLLANPVLFPADSGSGGTDDPGDTNNPDDGTDPGVDDTGPFVPANVAAVLAEGAVVDDVLTQSLDGDLTLFVVTIEGNGIGYEHWVLTDADGVVQGDFAFSEGTDPLLRVLRSPDANTSEVYFQVVNLDDPDTLAQNTDTATTVYSLAAEDVLAALNTGGTEAMTDAATVVTEIGWADVGAADLANGTVIIATQAGEISLPDGSSTTAVVIEQYDELNDELDGNTLYLTAPVDAKGIPIDGASAQFVAIPGEIDDFWPYANGTVLLTFDITPDEAEATLVDGLLSFGEEGVSLAMLAGPSTVSFDFETSPTALTINGIGIDIKTVIEAEASVENLTVELFDQNIGTPWVLLPDGKVAVTAFVEDEQGVGSDWLVLLNGDGSVSVTVTGVSTGGGQMFFPDMLQDPEGVVFAVISLDEAEDGSLVQPRGEDGLLFAIYRATPAQLFGLSDTATVDDLIDASYEVFIYSDLDGVLGETSEVISYPQLIVLDDDLSDFAVGVVQNVTVDSEGGETLIESSLAKIGPSIDLEAYPISDVTVLEDNTGAITDLLVSTLEGTFAADTLDEPATVFRFNIDAQKVTETYVIGTDAAEDISVDTIADIPDATHYILPGGTGQSDGDDVVTLSEAGVQNEIVIVDINDTVDGDLVTINGFDVQEDLIGLTHPGAEIERGSFFDVTPVTVDDLANFTIADFGLSEGVITVGTLNLFAVGQEGLAQTILFGTANGETGGEIAVLNGVSSTDLGGNTIVYAMPEDDLLMLPT